jgi:hypothetical protein
MSTVLTDPNIPTDNIQHRINREYKHLLNVPNHRKPIYVS